MAGKQIFRVLNQGTGVTDIYDASTYNPQTGQARKIGENEFRADWSGKAKEVKAPAGFGVVPKPTDTGTKPTTEQTQQRLS